MTNQSRVTTWVRKVFSEADATNAPERSLRLVEEAIELSQACGIGAEAVHRLVDYVFSRPVGVPPQEIAGCMVTLYAAAAALGIDAQEEFEKELARIQQPEIIERVRRRHRRIRGREEGVGRSARYRRTGAGSPPRLRCWRQGTSGRIPRP